jgi:hypothetical protein
MKYNLITNLYMPDLCYKQHIITPPICIKRNMFIVVRDTNLCGRVVRVVATDPEVPGSIPGATLFSEWVWNGVHSAS